MMVDSMADPFLHRSADFWDREVQQPTHSSWMEDPRIRGYINHRFGDAWPLDWFERTFPGVRFARALIIGCGTGPLERDLVRRNLVDRCDAFDGSLTSIVTARAEARQLGIDHRLHYFVADFNTLVLRPVEYDAVFFHQSLHHVAHMERLFRHLLGRMRSDALVYLDEYIGPSRTDWDDARMIDLRRLYGELPRPTRMSDELPYPIQADDPSEAIRSGEILRQLAVGFDVEVLVPYGGNVLSVLYPNARWSAIPRESVERLIAADEQAVKSDGPYYAVIVARRKSTLSSLVARSRYWLEPKLRRLRFEIRRRFDENARY